MDLINKTKADFEEFFRKTLSEELPSEIVGLSEMVSYHFGWNKETSVPGKRLRPLFMLLTYGALGGNPQEVFYPAAAMETLHNYTLVHDDIEDNGLTRHGQTALWVQYGMPLGINVGDYLASLSHKVMSMLPDTFGMKTGTEAIRVFQRASLEVIQGQQLDILYESYPELSVTEYLRMIRLKTSRLFAASITIAGVLSGADSAMLNTLDRIGEKLGLGFQIQDDYLGIWGNEDQIGKSVSTDLLTRKKAYPALLGAERSVDFRAVWTKNEPIQEDDLVFLKAALENIGVKQKTLELAKTYYLEAKSEMEGFFIEKNEYWAAFIQLLELMFAPSLG